MSDAVMRPIKLPVWRSVRKAYALVFRNFGFLVRVCGPWLVAAVLCYATFRLIDRTANGLGFTPLQEYLVSSFITGVMFAGLAVHWHRHVLHEAGTMPVSRTLLSYTAAALFIEWVFAIPIQLSSSAMDWAGDSGSGIAGAALLGYFVVMWYVTSRFWLVLPAIALNHSGASLAASWRMTKGNGMRLFWGGLLVVGSIVVPIFAGALWFSHRYLAYLANSGAMGEFASDLALHTAGLIVAVFAISFLSIAYRELVMKKAAG